MCISLYVGMYILVKHMWPSEVSDPHGAGVTGDCQMPNKGVGELNLGLLEEQYTLLTTEPFLQSLLLPSLYVSVLNQVRISAK